MPKEIKTDNFATKVVVGAVDELHQRKEAARTKYKVPFMKRERSKREKTTEYLEQRRP